MNSLEKLRPSDSRVTEHKATVHGRTYHYRLAVPPAGRAVRGTLLLVHGFPDLGFTWRNQVPFLAGQLGLRVIVPDMLGYGQTDAPAEVAPYSYKSICSDLVALVDHVVPASQDQAEQQPERFFIGGHDWGGAVIWRMVLRHADRLRGAFSVCTPYVPPSTQPQHLPLAQMIKLLPNFGYQQQLVGEELWRTVRTEDQLRHFLSALFGGVDSRDGERAFSTASGLDYGRLDHVAKSPLLSEEETAYYAREYARHGLQGPTNWYRVGAINYEEERELLGAPGTVGGSKIAVPSLMVVASNDVALPPSMSEKMGAFFDDLTKVTVPGSHWVLWQMVEQANSAIRSFLEPQLGMERASM